MPPAVRDPSTIDGHSMPGRTVGGSDERGSVRSGTLQSSWALFQRCFRAAGEMFRLFRAGRPPRQRRISVCSTDAMEAWTRSRSEPENAAQNWPMLNDVIEEAVVLIVYASPPIAEDGGEPVIEVATYASIQVPHEIGGSAEPAGHCPACEVYFRGEVVPALQADDRIHPSVAVARADKLASLIALRVRSTTPD